MSTRGQGQNCDREERAGKRGSLFPPPAGLAGWAPAPTHGCSSAELQAPVGGQAQLDLCTWQAGWVGPEPAGPPHGTLCTVCLSGLSVPSARPCRSQEPPPHLMPPNPCSPTSTPAPLPGLLELFQQHSPLCPFLPWLQIPSSCVLPAPDREMKIEKASGRARRVTLTLSAARSVARGGSLTRRPGLALKVSEKQAGRFKVKCASYSRHKGYRGGEGCSVDTDCTLRISPGFCGENQQKLGNVEPTAKRGVWQSQRELWGRGRASKPWQPES